jgi:hypothetical protein
MARALAGDGIDDDLEALSGQRFDGVRDQRNSPLPRTGLFRDA